MTLTTYVNFAGQCAEAFRYYEKHLGGKVGMMMTHGQSPQASPLGPDWKDKVLHARMAVAGTELSGADIPNAEPMRTPTCRWAWIATLMRSGFSRRCPRAGAC